MYYFFYKISQKVCEILSVTARTISPGILREKRNCTDYEHDLLARIACRRRTAELLVSLEIRPKADLEFR